MTQAHNNSPVWRECLTLFLVFFRMGLVLIGGGYVMLPLLQRIVVDRHKWISEKDLLDFYAISQSTPGIIAVNTATLIGYRRAGVAGAASATVGLVSPAVAIICVIAVFYETLARNPWVESGFIGMRIAVGGLLLATITGLLFKVCRGLFPAAIAAFAFVALTFFHVSPAPVILLSGLLGLLAFHKRG